MHKSRLARPRCADLRSAPKRGRLWLNEGSFIRVCGPDSPNHVWSHDVILGQDAGWQAIVRTLAVINEFTRGCLAIVLARGCLSN